MNPQDMSSEEFIDVYDALGGALDLVKKLKCNIGCDSSESSSFEIEIENAMVILRKFAPTTFLLEVAYHMILNNNSGVVNHLMEKYSIDVVNHLMEKYSIDKVRAVSIYKGASRDVEKTLIVRNTK